MYLNLNNRHGNVVWRKDLWKNNPAAKEDKVYLGVVHVDTSGLYHGVGYFGRRNPKGTGLQEYLITKGGVSYDDALRAVQAKLREKESENYDETTTLGVSSQSLTPVTSTGVPSSGSFSRNHFAKRQASTVIKPPPFISDDTIQRMLLAGEDLVLRVNLCNKASGEWSIAGLIAKHTGNYDVFAFTHMNPEKMSRMFAGTTYDEGRGKLTAMAKTHLDKGYDYDVSMDDPRATATRVVGNPPRTTDDAEVVWAMGAVSLTGGAAKAVELISTGNYVIEEILDGIRSVLHIRTRGNRFFGDKATDLVVDRPGEYTGKLPAWSAFKFPGDMTDTILDGYIYNPGCSLDPTAAKLDGEGVIFVVVDAIKIKGVHVADQPWLERRHLLVALFLQMKEESTSHFMRLQRVNDDQAAMVAYHQEAKRKGRRGTTLKNITSVYSYEKAGAKPRHAWYEWTR